MFFFRKFTANSTYKNLFYVVFEIFIRYILLERSKLRSISFYYFSHMNVNSHNFILDTFPNIKP